MLTLLLIEEDTIADPAIKTLMAEDICTIRFRDPLRLLDAMQELHPDILVIRRRDFPLHAQMIIGFIRFYQALSRCKVLVFNTSSDALEQTTNIIEDQFLNDPSILLKGAIGTAHLPSHRGSRLVAKAQRIMRE